MSTQFYPLDGCKLNASERQTAYANSTIHLFQSSFIPTPSNVKADYVAAEADYDAYASKTFTAWLNPILAPGGGYMIESPLVQFEVGATDPAVGNLIGGCWLQDSAAKIRATVIFTTPLPMQMANQGIPISLVDLFPTGV